MVSTSTKLFEGAFHVDAYLSAYGRTPSSACDPPVAYSFRPFGAVPAARLDAVKERFDDRNLQVPLITDN